ncbi:MAG: polysaccharide biosynthesis tyrosine autokinase [Lysobacterales bacterium]
MSPGVRRPNCPNTQILMRSTDFSRARAEVSLLSFWPVLVKRRSIILISIVLSTLCALVFAGLVTPKYRATALLQFERQPSDTVNVSGVTPLEETGDGEFYETQLQLLTTRSVAEAVASSILSDDPALAVLNRRSIWQVFTGKVSGQSASEVQGDTADGDREELIAQIRAGLVIDPVIDSKTAETMRWHNLWGIDRPGYVVSPWVPSLLVRLHFDSPDAALSARIANAFATELLRSQAERRKEVNAFAKEFLRDRLEQIRVMLEDSESALAGHARSEGVIKVSERASLSSEDLTALVSSLSSARQERINAQSRLRTSRRADAYSHPLLLQNANIQSMRSERARLEAEYQKNLLIYRPEYPELLLIKNQITRLDQQLVDEITAFKRELEANLAQAQDKEAMLQSAVNSLSQEVLALQGRRGSFTVLERDAAANRQLYATLLQRYREIDALSNLQSRNISVVDSALVPDAPYDPDLRVYLGWGAALGLFLGLLLASFLEFIDAKVKRPEQIESLFGVGVLGVIPKVQGRRPLEMLRNLRSTFSEAYRSARTSLEFSTDSGSPRCLLVTSPSPGDGKSTTALALAREYAILGRRVLLIDADLRNPSLHRILGGKNRIGLSSYLSGAVKPAGIIRPTRIRRLIFIPSGPVPANPAELLAGEKMAALLALVGSKFDQVIIDGPPILGLADAPILASMASGTLVVIASDSARIATARMALKRLLDVRGHIVGALMTKFASPASVHGAEYIGDMNYSYGEPVGARRNA